MKSDKYLYIYGAYFSPQEIKDAIPKLKILDILFDDKKINPKCIIRDALYKSDSRFTYIEQEYHDIGNKIIFFGIETKEMKDDEMMGSFKKLIEKELSDKFSKPIGCNFFVIDTETEDY